MLHRYISTYYLRSEIDFGAFKRDVLLFKTLALIQNLFLYIGPYFQLYTTTTGTSNTRPELDFISIAMIVSGYVVSIMATNALGIERTYFGAELGYCEPKWVTAFPYGYVIYKFIWLNIYYLYL